MNCGPAPCRHNWLDVTSFIDFAAGMTRKLCSRCGEVVLKKRSMNLDELESDLLGAMPWDAPKP